MKSEIRDAKVKRVRGCGCPTFALGGFGGEAGVGRSARRISFSPKRRSAMMPRLRQSSIKRLEWTIGLEASVYLTLMT